MRAARGGRIKYVCKFPDGAIEWEGVLEGKNHMQMIAIYSLATKYVIGPFYPLHPWLLQRLATNVPRRVAQPKKKRQ